MTTTDTGPRPVDDAATTFEVNGRAARVEGSPLRPLASVLRDELGLTGTKLGCEAGDCGSCTVLLDGTAIVSCLTPVAHAEGRAVVTVEGLAPDAHLHPLQDAFRRHNASQCGFCIPGILMAAVGLVERRRLDRADVVAGLAGNLCRCTGYESIVDAVLDAHAAVAGGAHPAGPAAAEGAGRG